MGDGYANCFDVCDFCGEVFWGSDLHVVNSDFTGDWFAMACLDCDD